MCPEDLPFLMGITSDLHLQSDAYLAGPPQAGASGCKAAPVRGSWEGLGQGFTVNKGPHPGHAENSA